MSIIMKCPDVTLFRNGWTVGGPGGSDFGSLLFDTNLIAPINDLSDGFTASAFFYLPSGASTAGIRFLQTQNYNDLSGTPSTSTAFGMFWTSAVVSSNTIFSITFRNGGTTGSSITVYDATVATSAITIDGWNHILIANDGGSTTKAFFNDASVTASKTGSLTSITTNNAHDLIQGGVYTNATSIGGTALDHGFHNIYFAKGYDDPATEANRRHFLTSSGTPALGVPNPPSNSDPELFISGNNSTCDHYENPGNTGVSHSVTRTNLTIGPASSIKVT